MPPGARSKGPGVPHPGFVGLEPSRAAAIRGVVPLVDDRIGFSRPWSNLPLSFHLCMRVRVQLRDIYLSGAWGLGPDCSRREQRVLYADNVSKMSTSVWGNQDGGRWVGAEFSHQEGALAQLEVEMCSGQSAGSRKAMQGFGMGAFVCSGRPQSGTRGEGLTGLCTGVRHTQRQLVRVDLGVKRKPVGHSFRGAPGSRS